MTAKDFNKNVTHPLQAFEWGEFRKKTGVKVIRETDWELTIHKIPYISWTIGYLPKGNLPDKKLIEELKKIGKENKCIFIQLEPNVRSMVNGQWSMVNLVPAAHPLFTKYTFVLNLTKSEDELLEAMHPKTRYNIKVAQKHGVNVVEDNSDKAFEAYLKLASETSKRQKFYAHTQDYHKLMWQTLKIQNSKFRVQNLDKNKLTAHLLVAKYKPKSNSELLIINSKLRAETLAAWILFTFKDTLYYPYGASSDKHREAMASNLMMWEAIKFGKKLGLKKFDMWGALGPNPDPKDPWYGFHKFKLGYGAELVEFIGSYDLVINPILYNLYKIANKLRWMILRFSN